MGIVAFLTSSAGAAGFCVSLAALKLSRNSTVAAERQAKAAEASLAFLAAQVSTAQQAADAATEQAELTRKIAADAARDSKVAVAASKGALRPLVRMARRMEHGIWVSILENQGPGMAVEMHQAYLDNRAAQAVSSFAKLADDSTLAPGAATRVRFDFDRSQRGGLINQYKSLDGRVFSTTMQSRADGNWTHDDSEL